MAKSRVIKDNGDTVVIQPTYKTARRLAAAYGTYRFTRWFGPLFLIAALVVLALYWTDTIVLPEGSLWVVYLIGALAAAAMFFYFAKPSQVMVDNEFEVNKLEYNKAVSNGTDDKWFTRQFSL